MTRLNVCLVDLKSYYPSPPFQLGLLVAYARLDAETRRSVDFEFLESPRTEPAAKVVSAILAAGADLVALSCYAWNYSRMCDVLAGLAAADARLPRILVGGPNAAGRFGAAMMRRFPVISALVEGEGEPAFRDICRSLVDSPTQDPFEGARNCRLPGEAPDALGSNPGHRIELLDDVPSPYLEGILPPGPSPIFYETNRGCPYRCAFCYWGNGNAKIYRMSHARIREEMEYFATRGVASFWLCDANFGILKGDAEIAEILCEVNGRHGYPFKHVGVNWAKDSSDRVLHIAGLLRRARIGCTTTLALQSVTDAAGASAQRYSMPSWRFKSLIREAHAQDLDTYTDLIWGLPGEGYGAFADGLEAVICTGVPAILIHQLYLLPGTAFYDHREQLGLELLPEPPEPGDVPEDFPWHHSDYWEYTVTSHPDMSRADQVRGSRMLGINHLLHNHCLGLVPAFYLARHGIGQRQVYEYLDRVLLGEASEFAPATGFVEKIRAVICIFADNVGLDEYRFYRHLSDLVWFQGHGTRVTHNEGAVAEFVHALFRGLCAHHGVCTEPWEQDLLSDLIDYGLLLAPKPAWRPKEAYAFRWDVAAVWADMYREVLEGYEEVRPETGAKRARPGEWQEIAGRVRARLADLLTREYLETKRGARRYRAENGWRVAPSKDNCDWLLSSRSRRVSIEPFASGTQRPTR